MATMSRRAKECHSGPGSPGQQRPQMREPFTLAMRANLGLRGKGALLGLNLVEKLQVVERADLGRADEGNGVPVSPGAAGAARAVNVDLRRFREGVVDHAGQVLDVDATGSDVGGDQKANLAGAHALHDLLAFGLRKIRRDGLGNHALLAQEFGDPAGFIAGVAEDDRAIGLLEGENTQKLGFTLAAWNRIVGVANLVHAHEIRRQLQRLGVAHEAAGKPLNALGNGGRKEQGLPRGRGFAEDVLDVLLKAHGQHLVALVEHRALDRSSCKVPRRMWSRMRPGVPQMTWAPARSCSI
jgi:hypothetical protein